LFAEPVPPRNTPCERYKSLNLAVGWPKSVALSLAPPVVLTGFISPAPKVEKPKPPYTASDT